MKTAYTVRSSTDGRIEILKHGEPVARMDPATALTLSGLMMDTARREILRAREDEAR